MAPCIAGPVSKKSTAVARARHEVSAVLEHGGVFHSLREIVDHKSTSGREVREVRAGNKDTAHVGGDPKREIEIFAAHPKVVTVQSPRFQGIARDEQGNAGGPTESSRCASAKREEFCRRGARAENVEALAV